MMTHPDGSHADDDLAALAGRLASDSGIGAVAIATLEGGRADRNLSVSGCGTAPGPAAVFQAASLSKPVMASLVLRMARRGAVSLDSPISDVFPRGYPHRQNLFALEADPIVDVVPVDILRGITPRMLLSHSAGFPNWASSGPLTLGFTPGTGWRYSGEGYVLLQRMVETITQRSLQQLAEAEIFVPLGMADSAFRLTDSIRPRLVPGAPRQRRFPHDIAASSLYTSARDYVGFVRAVLEDAPMLALMVRDPVALPTSWAGDVSAMRLAWGLGWALECRETPASIWHWGSNPGFRSLVLADIESRNAIVVLTSGETGMPLARALVQAAIPGQHPSLALDAVR